MPATKHKPKTKGHRSAKQKAAQKKASKAAAAKRAAKKRSHRPTLAKGGRHSERTCGKTCRVRLGKMGPGEIRRRKTAAGHVIEITVLR